MEVDLSGAPTGNSFTSDELIIALGASALPNGNILISNDVDGIIAEFTTSGERVTEGINISAPDVDFAFQYSSGIFFDENTNTILGTSFFNEELVRLDTEGNILSTIDLSQILPGAVPQGVVIDPATGNIIFSDDRGGVDLTDTTGGSNSIYELTPDGGQVLSSFDLFELSGFDDPEGLSIDPATRTLYVIADDDSSQNGDRILAYQISDTIPNTEFGGSNLSDKIITEGQTTAGSYLVDENGYANIPLLTVGDEIPLLEGEFPFVQTNPGGVFPVDNLLAVDSGDNPLTASETETFSLAGSFDGVSHTNIDGTNYVFVNHSLDTDVNTDTNGGQINGSRISLLAFDEDWDIIGGRNLVERVRIASVEGTNTLRNTINPATGTPFLGLVFAEYVLNPATGDYEPDLEAGNDSFIVGDPNFLALESDVAGLTWQERLEQSFAPTFNALGNNNFTSLGSVSIAETGFRRRGGQALPFLFSGDNVDNSLAYFHIVNGTTVPIEGFGAFAKEEIISAIDFRQTADDSGTPFGQTVLLSPEASDDDAELYMYVGDRVPGNAGGFADFEDTLYVLQLTDESGNVVAEESEISQGTNLSAQWVLVDGNPLNALDVVPDGNAINTLNDQDLSDWVNGNDDGVLRSTNFSDLGGIVEDPNNTSTFYLVSGSGLYTFTLSEDSPTAEGNFTLLRNGDFDSVEVDDNGNIVVQDNFGAEFIYDIATDTITSFAQVNQAGIDPNGINPWETEGVTEIEGDYEGSGFSAYLTAVAANSIVNISSGGFAEDGTSDELFYEGNLGTGGQLVLNIPIAVQPEETVTGTAGEDSFVASLLPNAAFDGNNDTVLTFSGNDVVDAAGGFGGNPISTGSGDDTIYVSSNDRAFGASGDDTFFTTGGSGNTLSGGTGDDEFYLSSGDRVLGGSGDDTFFGADGSNNRVSGGSGDDTFFIGSGDSVFGGTGADAFWITSGDLPTEASTIGGFEFDVDVIGVIGFTFDDLGFDGNTISIDGVEVANVVSLDTASLSESDFVFV